MRPSVVRTAVCTLLLALASAGCDERTLPTEPSAPERPFFSRPPAPGFVALARSTSLSQEHAVSRTIGPLGGRIEIAEAGVALSVPAGALAAPVKITVRAPAGAEMAFEFEPHGLEFLTPATIEVRVRGTEAEELLDLSARGVDRLPLDRFLGVYFGDDRGRGVEPLEILPAYRRGDAVAFDVEHFSGYVCATG